MPQGTFSDKFVIINGLLLMVVFFFIRIIWGFYAIAQLAIDMTYSLDQINKLIPATLLVLNFGLDVLNVFWFYKMVRIARKKASKGSGSVNKKSD
ncbi:TLC domain [Mycobacteroides abscessus subsp. abscessus]|nr:TLC domain [Mycobacteroides abscessus subsp. abscessus]